MRYICHSGLRIAIGVWGFNGEEDNSWVISSIRKIAKF